LPGVPLQGHHGAHLVQGDVLAHQLHRGGVEVDGVDDAGPGELGDHDGERPHASEHVDHRLAGLDQRRHPPPLGGEPGVEVRPPRIDLEAQPVLHVHRRAHVLPGDDLEVQHAELPDDPAVQERRSQARGRPEQGLAHLGGVGEEFLRQADDRYVPQDVEGGGEQRPQPFRDIGQDLVVPLPPFSFLEVPLLGLHALRRGEDREVDMIIVPVDVQRPVQQSFL